MKLALFLTLALTHSPASALNAILVTGAFDCYSNKEQSGGGRVRHLKIDETGAAELSIPELDLGPWPGRWNPKYQPRKQSSLQGNRVQFKGFDAYFPGRFPGGYAQDALLDVEGTPAPNEGKIYRKLSIRANYEKYQEQWYCFQTRSLI